jgi:BlaI family transcriptional regulator, penicillinase repressor
MARPPAKELTQRELQIMQLFWKQGEMTAAGARDALAEAGLDLAYTTVATLVKILVEKDFLQQTNAERPYRFIPVRSYEDVSRRLLGDLVDRVFDGSRELLLMRLIEQKRLTAKERAFLQQLLSDQHQEVRR